MASQNDMLKNVGNIWKFLDSMALSNPDDYKKFIDKVMKDGQENDLGPPLAQFVVETEQRPSVIPIRKYYVNIAEWKRIPPPETKHSPVPIVCSDRRKEVIEKEWIYIFDVAVNPVLFEKMPNPVEHTALVELAFKYIENKHSLSLSRKYRVLTENYMGNQDYLLNFMCPSALRDSLTCEGDSAGKKVSLFHELTRISETEDSEDGSTLNKPPVSSNETLKSAETSLPNSTVDPNRFDPIITANVNAPVLKELKTRNLKSSKKNETKLKSPRVEMLVDNKQSSITIHIFLPGVEGVHECDLNIAKNNISLLVTKKYELDLDIPLDISVDNSKAKFVKDQGILALSAPLIRKIS